MSSPAREMQYIGMKLRGGAGGCYHLLRGGGTLTVQESGVMLRGSYEPPSSAWIALALTLVTFGLVHASTAAHWVPTAAGPGFLPWYLLVRALRKRRIELPLTADAVSEAVLDQGGRMLAVRVAGPLGGLQLKDGWLGLRLVVPEAMVPELKTHWAGKLRQGAVHKGISSLVLILCLVALSIMMTAVLGAVAASRMSTYRNQAQLTQARLQLKEVQRAAVQWTMDKASCPSPVELGTSQPLGFPAKDPWGSPLKLTCEGSQISVRSAGPDGKFDTPDDLTTPGSP